MQQNLKSRVLALEQASPKAETVLFIILVGMSKTGSELTHIHDSYGNHWNRSTDETEEAFKARATSESPRDENQVAMLFSETHQ